MRKACFIDRDGVLIEEVNYLSSTEQVKLIPGTAKALGTLEDQGYLRIIISNQSGVARGYFDENAVDEVTRHIDSLLAREGVSINGWFYCPHHPKGSVDEYAFSCDCRKPEPGMLRQAQDKFDVDMSASCMIGDKLSDIQAGLNAGCGTNILVLSGHGQEEVEKAKKTIPGLVVAETFQEAVNYFIEHN